MDSGGIPEFWSIPADSGGICGGIKSIVGGGDVAGALVGSCDAACGGSSSSVMWHTRWFWVMRWRVGVVGGCDVAYAGPFIGDMAVQGRCWQRAMWRGF